MGNRRTRIVNYGNERVILRLVGSQKAEVNYKGSVIGTAQKNEKNKWSGFLRPGPDGKMISIGETVDMNSAISRMLDYWKVIMHRQMKKARFLRQKLASQR